MGLDCVPLPKAKPGHEAEWRVIMTKVFAAEDLSPEEEVRLDHITISIYETLGAPRVGFDATADAWIIKRRKATTAEEIAACLKESHGRYICELAPGDGVPPQSNAFLGLVDQTSFRGNLLRYCTRLVDEPTIKRAWTNMWPEEAVAYGRDLLSCARKAREAYGDDIEFRDESFSTLESGGRWYVYWGERGHPILAWY